MLDFTRAQVDALQTLMRLTRRLGNVVGELVGTSDPELDALLVECQQIADGMNFVIEQREMPVDLPSPEEVEQMAQAAGFDNVPF